MVGSGVMVLERGGSITTLGEVLACGRSRPVQFSPLSSDRRESRTEAWNRSLSRSSEHSSLLRTSGELREASSRETVRTPSKALGETSEGRAKVLVFRLNDLKLDEIKVNVD